MKNKRKQKKGYLTGILFLFPAMVLILITSVIPTVWNIVISFGKWNGTSAYQFVGLQNYIKVFTSRASIHTIKNSCIIAVVAIAVSMLVGIAMALMIYRITEIEGAVYRFIFYSPSMLPMTVVGLLFTFVFATDEGILNNLLEAVGLGSLTQAWLSTKTLTVVCVGIVQGWRFSGTIMMLIFTAIIALPKELYEDTKLIGATYRQEVAYVILPLIFPTIVLSLSMMSMWAFKTYDIVKVMTDGGPGDMSMVAPMYIVLRAFRNNEYGFASALSVVFAILILIIIVAIRFGLRREKNEY